MNSKGKLTDIGSMYLGGQETGVVPDAGNGKSSSAVTTQAQIGGVVACLVASMYWAFL